ncbi:CoA-binding protein [Methylocella sp.]|uniref:CoA-binding protein n=1 Tax=Methylocella sp. TaxID=1978226 RepID=UPI003783D386
MVNEALALPWRPKTIWMQIGVVNEPAAALAGRRASRSVMDRCPKIDYGRLGLG